MGIPKNQALRLICVTIATLAIVATGAFAKEKKGAAPKKGAVTTPSPATIVAVVNDSTITRNDLDRAMNFMLAQEAPGKKLSADEKKTAESQVLDQLVSAELLYQAAKKLEIQDIDKLVDARVAQNRQGFPSAEAFAKALNESGLTENDLRDFSRKEIYINNFIEKEIASKASVSDQETRKFYDDNKEKFRHDEMARASHILIGVSPGATAEEKKAAKEKAEAVLKRVKSGEDFAEVARKESTGPTAADGGDLGYIPKGETVPEFDKVVFSLKPGEISDLVETQTGYNIFKVVERKPAGVEPYDEVKEKIASFLKLQKIRAGINDLIEKLRKEGKVEIKKS